MAEINIDMVRSRETREDRRVRLEILRADARLQRYKELIFLGAGLGAAIGIGTVCIWIIIAPTFSQHAINWATATLTSFVTGILGYLTGRSTNKT